MLRRRVFFLTTQVLSFVVAMSISQRVAAEFTPAIRAELDLAIAQRKKGDSITAYQSLRRAIDALKSEDVNGANEYLQQVGSGSLETMLVDLRSEVVSSAGPKKARGSKGLESRLLLSGLYDKANKTLQQIEDEMPPEAAGLNKAGDIQDALQASSSLPDQMSYVHRLVEDIAVLARNLSKKQKEMLDGDLASAVDDRFEGLRKRYQQASRTSGHRLNELHFRNIKISMENELTSDASLTVKVAQIGHIANSIDAIRIRAETMANGSKSDKEESAELFHRLTPFADSFHTEFHRERLIAYDLEAGKRWWIRGRYGKGTLRFGLLKDSTIRQGTIRENMITQPILMPNPFPKDRDVALNFNYRIPVIEYIQAINPVVSRRHYVLWGSFSHEGAEKAVNYFISNPPSGTLEYAYFADDTPDIGGSIKIGTPADQVVGFVEYQMALAHFNRLLKTIKATEVEEVDALVAGDPRLRFYSCVSRLYDPISKESTLRDPYKLNNGQYERSGLRWLIALARVELAAMQVEVHRDWSFPTVTLPSESHPFDYLAYRELLWDAARTHYYSMRYYLPVYLVEGSFKNGALFRSLDPKEHYPLLKQEYAVAHVLCEKLQELLETDEDTTPAMMSELNSEWIDGFLTPSEAKLNGIIASNGGQFTMTPNRIPKPLTGQKAK